MGWGQSRLGLGVWVDMCGGPDWVGVQLGVGVLWVRVGIWVGWGVWVGWFQSRLGLGVWVGQCVLVKVKAGNLGYGWGSGLTSVC